MQPGLPASCVAALAAVLLCSRSVTSVVAPSNNALSDIGLILDTTKCSRLPPPVNGSIHCDIIQTWTECTASCDPGFAFSGGNKQINFACSNSLGLWSPTDSVPDCFPLCFANSTGCLNGGVCVAPDTCSCPPYYSGLRCEESLKCVVTSQPAFGSAQCSDAGGFRVCSLACQAGYRLAGPQAYVCELSTGHWFPSLPSSPVVNAFPDCVTGRPTCPDLAPPANGELLCSENDEGLMTCQASCSDGYTFVEPVPDAYKCVDGKWSPTDSVPKCVEVSLPLSDGILGYTTGVFSPVGKVASQEMGYGMAWGQTHYRTFDGKIYRFRGLGSYLLVGDMQDHTFHIYVNNDMNPECGLSGAPACERSLTVLMEEVRIELRRDSDGPAAFAQGERLKLPVITYGVVIEQSASYILLKSGLGFTLRWDGADSVFVQISETMLGMTYGLLGTFDRDCSNDFTSITGQLTSVAITFAATFRVNALSAYPSQADFCDFQHTLSGFNPTSLSALLACKDLLNTACKDVVDPIPFYDACAEDICRAGGDASFVCDSMAAYFRECSRHGISVEWRSAQRCPIQCPCGMVYNSCGSSCPKTCFDATYDCEDDLCIDGCHCPEGTYLHNGTCLKREECPCLYIRREFTPGTRIQQDCNTCICQYGKWTCSQNQCDATCAVIGEVSYTTFDGRTYEFEGECQYTLVRGVSSCSTSLSYQIDVQLTKDCNQGGFSRAVILTVSGESARLGEAGQLLVSNSEEKLPYAGQGFQVERVSQEFVKLTLLNGLTLLFDGRNRVYVTAHPALMGSMEGLCGNFDNHQLNDFRTPLGDVESAPGAFANKWKALATCASAAVEVVDPCEINQYRRLRAQSVCGLLLQAPFSQCHEVVSHHTYYDSCMNTLCSTDLTWPECDSLADYSLACVRAGVAIAGWRDAVPECVALCPMGMQYLECGSACDASCGSLALELSARVDCSEQCVQGCSCPPGSVLDYEGRCVPPEDCPCVWEGIYYVSGEARMQDCNICECYRGKWLCTTNDCGTKDLCGPHQEYVSCKDPEPLTCDNMHLPRTRNTPQPSAGRCAGGCQCDNTTVWDAATGACVLPQECPCYHGGMSYGEGESMKVECNLCVCINQQWQCETKLCSGLCTAYGSSHIKSFDGKLYQFQGSCEYVYAQSIVDGPLGSFAVSAENVPCGTSGTTCTKAVTLAVTRAGVTHRLRLVRGEPVAADSALLFHVSYVGRWVFVRTDMGVTLSWDRGTHLQIKLDQGFSKGVMGLCGDYDGNQLNDFTTPQGIVVIQEDAFADSWKVRSYCLDAKLVTDTCALFPQREAWAKRKCGIIRSEAFAACHAEVPYYVYFERCVYDACGCDSGADCECLCTAVAAYAQECNRYGVYVYWRTPEFCPMQCDGCMRYDPCVPACPKTCENYERYEEVYASCPDVCVEGCRCVHDNEVFNELTTKCMRLEECVCKVIDGVLIYDGQKIDSLSDECRSCYCMDHDIQCIGPAVPQDGHASAVGSC
ncbi:SCO-spondin-like [Lethenteron reissneri]|uniref:SCO-spondin-like n=1 Tax=Lethenteron reissneri TaxID=7753 RepID=UPI002AB6EB5D|nr:SCO-spondin-like [Lethenteron reissneri]